MEAIAGPDVVEAAPGIAALHIDEEDPSSTVEAAHMGMAQDTVLIPANKNTVSPFFLFLDKLDVRDFRHLLHLFFFWNSDIMNKYFDCRRTDYAGYIYV